MPSIENCAGPAMATESKTAIINDDREKVVNINTIDIKKAIKVSYTNYEGKMVFETSFLSRGEFARPRLRIIQCRSGLSRRVVC